MMYSMKSHGDNYLPHVKWLWMQYTNNKYFLCVRIMAAFFFLGHALFTISIVIQGKVPHILDMIIVIFGVHYMLVELSFATSNTRMSMNYAYDIKVKDFWSIHATAKDTQKQIQQKIFKIEILLVCFYVILLGVALLSLKIDRRPQWPFLEHITNLQYILFWLLLAMVFVGVSLVVYVHLLTPLDFGLSINIQMMILGEYFNTMTDDLPEPNPYRTMEVFHYQNAVYQRLVIGIKQHKKIVRFAQCVFEFYGTKIPIAILLNSMLGFGMTFSYTFSQGNLLILLLLLNWCIGMAFYNLAGQLIFDGFAEFAVSLHRCPIYNWNVKNKKLLLLFIIFAQIKRVFRIIGIMDINLNSLVLMLRIIYSLATVTKSLGLQN